MVKVLHAADLHLDSAFVGLSAEAARARRAGQRELLETIVEKANELQVDLLLLAGDLLDGRNAYYETAFTLSSCLANCRAQVFLTPGNHDPYNAASPYRSVRFPSNVHVFQNAVIEEVPLPELNCVVYGAGFTDPVCETPLLSGFHAPQDGRIHIMVLHGECTEGASKNNPIRKSDLEQSGLHYAALGHIHKGTPILHAGKTAYAYPGCPEGRGFDECGEKGVLVGEVCENGVNMEFLPLSGYVYEQKNITVTCEADARSQLNAVLPESAPKANWRITLTGTSEELDCVALRDAFVSRVGQLILLDRTVPVRSPWEGEEAESLKGAFLRKLHTAYNVADENEQKMILQAVKYGVAALENREDA